MLNKLIRFFLENKLVAFLLLVLFIGWGIATAPFSWQTEWLPRDPVPVDAIPDIGENQQIVFTEWPGRSPQDIEDQITYPLTTALMGIPGVKTIRSNSMFGFSSIYIIFDEDIEFYWSRSRILEKLNSLPSGTLPEDANPSLGPDATALGQIFWYTLEGRDPEGNVTGGWDLHELRTIQDFTVKYALSSAEGVSEVASIGGYVKEYQVDIDPAAMKSYNVTLQQVMAAVQNSNLDVGAKTIEVNNSEYFIRGLGYIKSISDLEESVVVSRENVPVRIKDIARVTTGPAARRGVLDKEGAEVVGGVVVARYGSNPLAVINNVKDKIASVAPGLPTKILDDGTVSRLTIVPFYDRTKLIRETLGTLEEALSLEILITIIVIILMVMNLRASLLISGMLPVAVLMCFIAMRYFGVDANIVALSGIAIAIGTMVDMGIVLSENMIRHLDMAGKEENKLEVIYRATTEVASAVVTAVASTIVSFLPVFMMVAAEGKLFRPLAFTKTFALFAAIILALVILPPFAHSLFTLKITGKKVRQGLNILGLILGVTLLFFVSWAGVILIGASIIGFSDVIVERAHPTWKPLAKRLDMIIFSLIITWFMTRAWLPLGPQKSLLLNFFFVALMIYALIGAFYLFIYYYPRILSFCLRYKLLFLALPTIFVVWGIVSWLGFKNMFGIDEESGESGYFVSRLSETFPGIGKEFMPSLDEGAFLLMPTTMPHAGVEESKEVLQQLDMAVASIPEVDLVVGKMGRVNSALDPAPISMFENVINYKSEYITNEHGERIRFKVNKEGDYERDENGELIRDKNGEYFRQWRDHIKSPDDIWEEISQIRLPGVTAAPKLQPIETRLIMLQTGMRAPMGIKVMGPNLDTIQEFALKLENILTSVEGVKDEAVFADRIVGKPYLEIDINRKAIARYGLSIKQVQHYIEVAIGGMKQTVTVEGRERYPVRLRYPRELRDNPDMIHKILVPAANGVQIPLSEIANFNYVQGPQSIKSENTFLQGYVLFDKEPGYAETNVVVAAQEVIEKHITEGHLIVPAGVSYVFAGNYENQVRAEKRLSIVLPVSLFIIFLILYFQFRSVATTAMIFTGILVAFSGGFILIWLYGKGWFMDINMFGTNFRELFSMDTINLSVAVWVGFIALFGIATDDGVLIATYLKQLFDEKKPVELSEIRATVIEAGSKRVRPALMTTATTLLALLPVLSSTGRGSDIMVPMAIPVFGGMAVEIVTLFVVPVLFSWMKERRAVKQ